MSDSIVIPKISGELTVIRGERILCDGELADIVSWTDLPTFFVRVYKTQELKEVEPWRLHKIQKPT